MDFSPANKMCSFCGVQGTASTKFAGGLGAMMCPDCLETYHAISRSPARVAAISSPPWEAMSDAELVATLPLILRSAAQVNDFAADWIDLIRQRNVSWAEIGKSLGVSRQAAWERFARRERHDDTG